MLTLAYLVSIVFVGVSIASRGARAAETARQLRRRHGRPELRLVENFAVRPLHTHRQPRITHRGTRGPANLNALRLRRSRDEARLELSSGCTRPSHLT